MIHVPDEVAREIKEDLQKAYRRGVGGVRTKMNAEFLEDLLEDDRPDLDKLASEVTHARTDEVTCYSVHPDDHEYEVTSGTVVIDGEEREIENYTVEISNDLEEYTGEVD